jgi:hypothetical protein
MRSAVLKQPLIASELNENQQSFLDRNFKKKHPLKTKIAKVLQYVKGGENPYSYNRFGKDKAIRNSLK